MKKMAMVVLCVMVLSVVAAIGNEAVAAPTNTDWYNCTAVSVGALPAPWNFYFVFATNNDGWWANSRLFFIDATNAAAKPMLATLLTGYASGGAVALYIPGFSWSAVNPPPTNTVITGVAGGAM